jgi:hypothetical protein
VAGGGPIHRDGHFLSATVKKPETGHGLGCGNGDVVAHKSTANVFATGDSNQPSAPTRLFAKSQILKHMGLILQPADCPLIAWCLGILVVKALI